MRQPEYIELPPSLEDEVQEWRGRWRDIAVSISIAPFDWHINADRNYDGVWGIDIGPIRFSLLLPWTRRA